MIFVGQVLPGMGVAYGFGRDCYHEVRVEAIGADWIVARDGRGVAWFTSTTPAEVERTIIRVENPDGIICHAGGPW